MEPITDSWYLTSVQAGFEPWSGGVGLGVDSFSAEITGVSGGEPPVLPPPEPPTGGTVISDQFGTTTTTGGYVVQNNAWNNSLGQTIVVGSDGFAITEINGSAPTNGAPLGYPSIFEGWHWGTSSVETTLPLQLGQIESVTSSVDYAYPTTGVWNAAYDIWLDPSPTTTGVNEQEIMIWFNQQGPIQPVGSVVGNTTIDGQDFVVWDGHNGLNNVMSYVTTSPMEAWDFNVLSFVEHTRTMEPITDSWYLTSIQAGFEPWSGGVGLGVDSFSAEITGVS
ncbi:hypothetical protein F6B93_17515 [Mycobacterium spongiae]|uniref:Glycosyl hydrolase family 12 n=2 Tax=Mycobacterium spongiae TaxID=886343 RepID=A0A975K504_9MYCO|nr:hypothetical protein F6B93_17515 [Mycobacterium spongiae]